MDSTIDYLNDLPLELQVHLMKYLGGFEKYVLCEANPKSKALTLGHSHLSFRWKFDGPAQLSGKQLNQMTKDFKKQVTQLALEFSPWISSTDLYPALNRCANLTHLDILESNVNGPMLVKILSGTRLLKQLSWTVDAKKLMHVANRVGGAKGGHQSTGKSDFQNARKTVGNISRLRLAGYVSRNSVVNSVVVKNYKFLVSMTSEKLESLTLVAKGSTTTSAIEGTSALDVLADVVPAQQAIQLCRTRLDRNMRSDNAFQNLKELDFVWTGDKFGLSEILLGDLYTHQLLPLLCYFNQHQDKYPTLKLSKLTLPSLNGRLFHHFYTVFPHLLNKCALDCSEMKELTILNFNSQHTDHWFPRLEDMSKLIDLDAMPQLRVLKVFGDSFNGDELKAKIFSSDTLEKLQIRCSPGVETRSRKTFGGDGLISGIGDVLSACSNLTHLDIGQCCPLLHNDGYRLLNNSQLPSCLKLKGVVLTACLAFSNCDDETFNLQKLLPLIPNLQCLEIVDHEYLPSVDLIPHKARLASLPQSCCLTRAQQCGEHDSDLSVDPVLSSICDLKELTSLTLAVLPSPAKLSFLEDLAKSCPRLEFLSLARIGLTGACEFVQNLTSALPHFLNLKNLRIDHPGFPAGRNKFLRSLRQCATLERLVIFCSHETLTKETEFVETVKSLPNLHVLQLFSDTPMVLCGQISKQISCQMKIRHPGFHVLLTRMFGADFGADSEAIVRMMTAIPLKHWNEMTSFQSRVFPVL